MEQKKTYIEYRCDECNKIIPYGSEIAVKANSDGWWPYDLFCSESCFVKYAKRKAKLEKVNWKYEQEYRYIASPENGFLVEFISEHGGQSYFGNYKYNYKYIIFDECRIEFDPDYRMFVGLNECLKPIDTTSDCDTPSIKWIERAFDYKKTVERFGAFKVLHCTDYEEYRNYLRNMREDFPIDLLNFCIEYLKNGEDKLIERMEMFRGLDKFVVLKCADKYALIRFT